MKRGKLVQTKVKLDMKRGKLVQMKVKLDMKRGKLVQMKVKLDKEIVHDKMQNEVDFSTFSEWNPKKLLLLRNEIQKSC